MSTSKIAYGSFLPTIQIGMAALILPYIRIKAPSHTYRRGAWVRIWTQKGRRYPGLHGMILGKGSTFRGAMGDLATRLETYTCSKYPA